MVNNQDPGDYFLKLSKLGSGRGADDFEMDEEEEVPKELNTINSSGGFLVVSTDKLSVQYKNINLHGHDVGVVQANCPAPVRRIVYYFEIFVKNAGAKGQIGIGFTNEHFKMRRQPGWEVNSYGYHGDDGLLYRGQGKGESFGPTYTSGDTVGGGINYATQEFFFTSVVSVDHLVVYVESVDLNEMVASQLGSWAFALEERLKQQMTIEKISVPENASYWIVRSYLLHYGYQDTLSSFDWASKNTLPPISAAQANGFSEQGDMYALSHRKILRQLIRSGEIDSAFVKLKDWYPEIVQVGKLEEAVKYGRTELAKFFGLTQFEVLLQDCIALLAYEEPLKSSVGYLLDTTQREVVADAVNTMVLSTDPNMIDPQNCLHSYLEKLLMQLTTCCLERRSLNGDQGEAFDLHRVLHSGKGGKW
ncbi:hypothetical protein HHK36_009129 [Tetracentron sinense]|uniref:Ran-binding protein 10 n=1 Tax=Tetracentron sinense TaxID=13715 RepID=A0A834ZCH1_TETSI|nr:hypothetical protein HHK36_009129 [Tetracentron sinense]